MPLRPAVGFYTAAVLGTLETADKVTGKTVGLLLPFLLGGLASEMADYRAATYMIVAQLARRAVLQREFADELLVRVCKVRRNVSLPQRFRRFCAIRLTTVLFLLHVLDFYEVLEIYGPRQLKGMLKRNLELRTQDFGLDN